MRYTTPRTHYLRIADAAFIPGRNGDSFRLVNGVATFNSGTDSLLSAPVYLPDGATVTSVEFVFADTSASADVTARLLRKTPDATLAEPLLVSATSSGDSGEQTILDTTITSPVVDNQAYHYYLLASIPGGETWKFSATTIKSVLITYTVEETE